MIIVMKAEATKADADELLTLIEQQGLTPLYLPGEERTVLGALGDERVLAELNLQSHPHVDEVKAILSPYKKVSRELHPEDTIVTVGECRFSPERFTIIAGPALIESQEQIQLVAKGINETNVHLLRAGLYKSNLSPYTEQHLGLDAISLLTQAAESHAMSSMTEVKQVSDIEALSGRVDLFQIGSENMSNLHLLDAAGQSDTPVLLTRNISAKADELLVAAECIFNRGNEQIILCESGIRTFETIAMNTLDLNAVAYIKQRSHLPVIVDPSYSVAVNQSLIPIAKAAVASGADGLLLQVSSTGDSSDKSHSLSLNAYSELIHQIEPFIEASGRTLS